MRDLTTMVIVWSGEIRTHSKDTFDSICRIYSPHYKLIHVGHTWDHCETPSTVGNFTHFSKTNQSEMVDLMKQDPMYFPTLRQDAKSTSQYTWSNPDEYVKVHGDIFKMIWGQVWSHFSAMQLCKKLENRHNIAGYVRARWDIESSLFSKNMISFVEGNGDFFSHDTYAWAKHLGVNGVQDHYDTCMKRILAKINGYANDNWSYVINDDWTTHEASGRGWGQLWINDIHWIQVNAMCSKQDQKETIEGYPTPDKVVSDMLGTTHYTNGMGSCFPDVHPSAHTLWGCVFDYLEFRTLALFPSEIALICRPVDHIKNSYGI